MSVAITTEGSKRRRIKDSFVLFLMQKIGSLNMSSLNVSSLFFMSREPVQKQEAFKETPKETPFERDFIELMEGRQAGHMGKYEFSNSGMKEYERFTREHPEYYVLAEEQDLIEKCASVSANLLKGQKITIVSRGPGNKFAVKEGALIRAFCAAGIEIEKIVYIDCSKSALTQSVKEGKKLLPNAEHQAVKADIFDPNVLDEYDVTGLEVGMCFGLTPMNAEGRHDGMEPLSSIERNLSGIRGQMKKGAHLIAVYDHNTDVDSIEKSYASRGKFAKNFLVHHFQRPESDFDDVEYVVKYGSNSHILAHGFKFHQDVVFNIAGRDRVVSKGVTLWFNNSVKLPRKATQECNDNVGFAYLAEQKVIMAANDRLGYHHVISV